MFLLENNKLKQWFDQLLPIEQKAAKVTVACGATFLAVLLGTVITVNILAASKGKVPSDSSDSGNYVNSFPLDEEKLEGTILEKTKDAGEEYLNETLFVGDSNTVALFQYGLLPLNQVAAKVGISVQAASTDKCCYFENDQTGHTIVETIAKMKPRRVVFSFGTNDAPYHTTEEFIEAYTEVLDEVKEVYPYTDIIINAVYPIAKQNSYPEISMGTIDAYNQTLSEMCQEEGYKFLNTTELLKGSDGYLQPSYANSDGIHLNKQGLENVLMYVREHAYTETKDKRPDTDNIPNRRNVEVEQSSSSANEITASYHVEVANGETHGTLQGDGFSGESSKKFTVSDKQNQFTVTAVPNDGYEFVRWSDGVTTATRTDKNFTQNLSVTAIFRAKFTLSVTASHAKVTANGENVTFTVNFAGSQSTQTISWQLNGKTLSGVTGTSVTLNVKPGDQIVAVCDGVSSSVIKMELKAQLTISASATSCMVGDAVTFTANGEGLDLSQVVWKVNGTQQGTGKSFSFRPTSEGKQTISASVGDSQTSVTLAVAAPTPPPAPSSSSSEPVVMPSPTPNVNPTPSPIPEPTATPEPSPSSSQPEESTPPVQESSGTAPESNTQ